MKQYLLVILLFVSLGIDAQNTYPFVLVHGFAGWGRDELLGLKYWGGLQGDLQQYFVNQGIQMVTVQMGPVSSNWDRACEMFAELKGGTVDYGLVHSEQNLHSRYGRTYSPLIPNWGPNQKVHLIAHSQGGQDARLLVSLLNNGSPAEIAGTPAGNLSVLFQVANLCHL
jgi:triacylglycerol lipase